MIKYILRLFYYKIIVSLLLLVNCCLHISNFVLHQYLCRTFPVIIYVLLRILVLNRVPFFVLTELLCFGGKVMNDQLFSFISLLENLDLFSNHLEMGPEFILFPTFPIFFIRLYFQYCHRQTDEIKFRIPTNKKSVLILTRKFEKIWLTGSFFPSIQGCRTWPWVERGAQRGAPKG